MGKEIQYRRLWLLALLMVSAFCGLGYRLVDLQVLRHDQLSEVAQDNVKCKLILEPRRGEIRDVRGNLLATSVFVKTICADPGLIGNHQTEVAHAIAPILQLNEAELAKRLEITTRTNEQGRVQTNNYVVIARKVKSETWKQVQDAMEKISFGIDEKKLPRTERAFLRNLRTKAIHPDVYDDQLRIYPNEALAAHVLGYIGMQDTVIDNQKFQQSVGMEGIEHTFDNKLSGVRGWRLTETDRSRREIVAYREQEVAPRDGLNVVLTIDSGIQYIVETELAEAMKKHTPISISATVVRPRTGEILAMATLPNYDPNKPGAYSADSRRNRVIADLTEPGSTFKIVVVSGGLNEQIVSLQDQFDCEHGHFVYAGKTLHDHEAYGMLTVENIITKSSNIGAAKIGIKMGEDKLYQYIKAFGFGDRTGIPLPGERYGLAYTVEKWNKLSISRIPMGHEVAVTPLQTLMAMSAIANDGRLMRPMLVSRLEDGTGHVVASYSPQLVRQVIDPATAHKMVTALKTVVSADGTAPKAHLDYYTVAGKTGTAQKAGAGGYLPGKYFSSFIGFFPADNPELCISVVMDEPKNGYYGGQTAAPVFHNIAVRAANYLSIPPETEKPETMSVTSVGRHLTTGAAD